MEQKLHRDQSISTSLFSHPFAYLPFHYFLESMAKEKVVPNEVLPTLDRQPKKRKQVESSIQDNPSWGLSLHTSRAGPANRDKLLGKIIFSPV